MEPIILVIGSITGPAIGYHRVYTDPTIGYHRAYHRAYHRLPQGLYRPYHRLPQAPPQDLPYAITGPIQTLT